MAVEQCYAYARRMWNAKYPNNKLVEDPDITCAPQLWNAATSVGYKRSAAKAVANSIVCWDDGGYGHVAWVRSVNSDGTINISESNWPKDTGPTDRDNITYGTRGASNQFEKLGCVYP